MRGSGTPGNVSGSGPGEKITDPVWCLALMHGAMGPVSKRHYQHNIKHTGAWSIAETPSTTKTNPRHMRMPNDRTKR